MLARGNQADSNRLTRLMVCAVKQWCGRWIVTNQDGFGAKASNNSPTSRTEMPTIPCLSQCTVCPIGAHIYDQLKTEDKLESSDYD